MKKSENITNILGVLPDSPGVYRYFDSKGVIIYVGKAKNLKNRVRSYFNSKNLDSKKTRVLVSKIADIKYIVTPTEYDALLLENTLIKKHQPRYNILLKDDKTYPYICVKKERFPRIFSTRNVFKDGSDYFGPYSNGRVMKVILALIKEIYQIRSCSFNLSTQNVEDKKFKVCLDYHIKKCLGPCENLQSEENYNRNIKQIKQILKGETKSVIDYLKAEMITFSEELEFEKAQANLEKIELLKNYQSKSTVVNPKISDVDVFTIDSDVNSGYVNFIKVINGTVVQSSTIEIKKKLEETNEEMLQLAILELRNKFKSTSRTIFTNIKVDYEMDDAVKMVIPQQGDKKKLIDFSLHNVRQFKFDKLKTMSIVDPERHSKRIVDQIQKDLRLKEKPVHIECFDNSNFQGTNAVAACVVFKNAKPSKKDYRHFNIKTVEGPDDFASMEEVVYRRYKRLKDENQPLPQLVIVDGGKGQLSSGVKALKDLDLFGKIAIVGIAKRLEEIYFPGDSLPLYIDKKSESLKTIQHLRNEAHRFGITHHRNKRSKNAFASELDEIKGIGEVSIKALLKHFKYVKNIKVATNEQLLEVVNQKQAKAIRAFYK
ncbi:MAG: excinuclease ABC subunit UvrC [Flavobacteriales bacterium]